MREHDTTPMRLPFGAARVRPYIIASEDRRARDRATARTRVYPYLGALRQRPLRAGRDAQGNIRLRNGRGALVALASHTRGQVQEWRDQASSARFIREYDAALALMLREEMAAALLETVKTALTQDGDRD